MPEIYLDNAATSWPKPEEVYQAVEKFMRLGGGTPARGRYPKAQEAESILSECRRRVARLLGAETGYRLTFTSGATESLNLALKGCLPQGAHVVVAEIEHNSVFRPLARLRREREVQWTVVLARPDGTVDPARVREAMRSETRLVACSHASNVLGARVDIEGIAAVAHEKGALLLVDAAQTTGVVPIHMPSLGADFLVFTGHKSLLGLSGTGGLIFRENLDVVPLKEGGTGTLSEVPEQPTTFPDRYESGSPNLHGLAGLSAGVAYLERVGVASIKARKSELVGILREGLLSVRGVRVYGAERPEDSVGIVSFNVGQIPAERVGNLLWERSGVMVRTGLHCAPHIHARLGTQVNGTVRVGIGWASTAEHVRTLVDTVRTIVQKPELQPCGM